MPFDIEGARSAGYSDAEIAGFMAQREGFDIERATKAGYQPGDVIGFLAERSAQKAGSPPLAPTVAASTPAGSASTHLTRSDRRGPAAEGSWEDPREGSWDDRSEARKGVESAVTGIKAMGPAAKVAGSSLVINRIGERLANWDKIDQGGYVPRAEGLAYQRADAAGRQQLREDLLAKAAQQKEFIGESVKLVKQYQQEQVRNKGKTADFTDIEDVKGFTDWLAFNGAAGAVYLGPVMVAAAVGGPVGAGAVSYGLAAGELNADRVAAAIDMNRPGRFKNPDRQDGIDSTQGIAGRVADTVPSTLAFAAPNAALDVVAGPVRGVLTKPLKGLTKGEALRAAPGMVGRDIVEEGITGGLQEGVNIAAERYVGEQQGAVLTKENAKRVLNAATAEAAGGMVGGGANAGVAMMTAPVVKTPEQTAAPVLAAGSVDEAIAAAQRETSAPLPTAVAPAAVSTFSPLAKVVPEPAANPQASAAVDRIAEILGQPQESPDAGRAAAVLPVDPGGGERGLPVGADGLAAGAGSDGPGAPTVVPGNAGGVAAGGAVPPRQGGDGSDAVGQAAVWYGRRGDGYATAQDAEAAMPSRQRARPDLQWSVDTTPEGRFYLSGKAAEGEQPATAPAPAAAPSFQVTRNPSGTVTVQGDQQAIREALTSAGVTQFAAGLSGVMVGRSQAEQALQVLQPQAAKEDAQNIPGIIPGRAAPQTAPQAAPALESANSSFTPGSASPAAPPPVVYQQLNTTPVVDQNQAEMIDNAAQLAAPMVSFGKPKFQSTINPSGTLTVRGDQEAIKATLRAAGITVGVVKRDGSVLVGKSQAGRAQEVLAQLTNRMDAALAEAQNQPDGQDSVSAAITSVERRNDVAQSSSRTMVEAGGGDDVPSFRTMVVAGRRSDAPSAGTRPKYRSDVAGLVTGDSGERTGTSSGGLKAPVAPQAAAPSSEGVSVSEPDEVAPESRAYGDMSPEEKAAYDKRQGIRPGRRAEVDANLARSELQKLRNRIQAASFGQKRLDAISFTPGQHKAADVLRTAKADVLALEQRIADAEERAAAERGDANPAQGDLTETPIPAQQAAAPAPQRSETRRQQAAGLIELRKRRSVLESLLTCLG